MPVLYKFNGSAPSRAVLMLVDILKLKLEMRDVNTITGENLTPEYLKKNHLHTVPILEDEDLIIVDSHVIMTYLVTKYAEGNSLYPTDLKIKSNIDQRMYLESTILTPKIILVFNSLKQKKMAPNSDHVAAIKEAYGFLEKYLEKTSFLATNHLTLADVSCVSSIASLNCIVPIDGSFPKLKSWFEKLGKEEWFKKINSPGVAIFEKFLKEYQANAK